MLVSVIFPYITAYQLIHRAAKAQPGETVLYHDAAGRVGVASLEFAKLADLRVYGTASTAESALVERHPSRFRDDLLEPVQQLREGSINPVVAERVPLADARRAHELRETAAAKSKLVLIL